MRMHYPGYNAYKPGDAWFISDRTGQRFRRSQMVVEWTGLRVGPGEVDPRPPQQYAPNIYPEGLPFIDSRPPQDFPDRLADDTTLYPIVGGIAATDGLIAHPANGQDLGPGSISPQDFLESVEIVTGELSDGTGGVIGDGGSGIIGVTSVGVPQGPNVLEDDVTFITGRVFSK